MADDSELASVRRQLADLEQLADVGFWDFDVASSRAVWSDGQCRLYGLSPGTEVTYDGWIAMVHPDDRDMINRTIGTAIERCGDYGFDHRFHRASDDTLRWTRCRGRVFAGPDGSAARIFGVSIDTTDEHGAAATLTDFIANAAHELRTPAAAIAQAVQALEIAEGDDRRAVLDILNRQAARLRALTTNLVDLAMVDTGPSASLLEQVDLAAAVAEAATNAPAPEGRTLDLSGVPAGLTALADKAALDRVLVNLLTNAWRYGGPNVRVQASASDVDTVEIRVADDGMGVPEETQRSLFQPFRRGPQRHPEASGLGLAIVDRLVHRMGGTIHYEDAPSGGAVFVLDLDAS
jgi:signal transduction histidine kinase